MNRLDWTKESRKGINANDVAAIMGVDKNRNALDVYIEKTEQDRKISVKEDSLYFEIKLEELVAREFALRAGKRIRKDLRNICCKEYKFMLANIDRKIIGENAILECKVINDQDINYFEEELMGSFLLEAQHNMKVKEAEVCYIAALINNEKFILEKINRDDKLISKIVKEEEDFWINHVEKRIKPKINKK